MTKEEFEFLERVKVFVFSNPSLLEHVVKAATEGIEHALKKARDDRHDMEVILMHQISKTKIPRMKEITYPLIAEKLKELEDRRALSFNWSFVIEEMEQLK